MAIQLAPDELAAFKLLIEQIAEEVFNKKLSPTTAKVPSRLASNCHSVPEIRDLIQKNYNALKSAITSNPLASKEFDIVVLRHELAKLVVLRDGDLEVIGCGSGGATQPRWDHQVGNAVSKTHDWPFSALIVPSGTRGKYIFADSGEA